MVQCTGGTMRTKIYKRRWIVLGIIILLICAAGAGLFLLQRNRPSQGIVIHPKENWSCLQPVYYSQKDPAWGDDQMGLAPDVLKVSGCLITSIAASMSMQEAVYDSSFKLTPKELNAAFSSHQVYDKQANILWNPLREYLSGWTVLTPEKPDGDEIEHMLSKGHYPIVKVRMPSGGAVHWVLLMEARDGDYYCMDPLNEESAMVPLSQFNDTVYSVRCLVRE